MGTTGPLINTLLGFFNGFSHRQLRVVTARAYGARDRKSVHDAVHTTILTTFLMAILFTGLGMYLTPYLLRMMKTPGDMMSEATTYLRIYFMGVSGLMFYNMGAGILRAVGDSRRPLYFLVFSAIVNTAGDLIFVLVFHMGVAGVAYATILAQALSAALVLYVLARSDGPYKLFFRRLCIKLPVLRQIVGIGLPTALQGRDHRVSNVFVQSYINAFGSDCAAAGPFTASSISLPCCRSNPSARPTPPLWGRTWGAGQRTARQARHAGGADHGRAVHLHADGSADGIFQASAEPVQSKARGALLRLAVCDVDFALLSVHLRQRYPGRRAARRGRGLPHHGVHAQRFVVIRQIYLYIVSHVTHNAVLVGLGYPLGWVCCAISLVLCYRLLPWEKKQGRRCMRRRKWTKKEV